MGTKRGARHYGIETFGKRRVYDPLKVVVTFPIKACPICKKEFQTTRTRRVFCSRECQVENAHLRFNTHWDKE